MLLEAHQSETKSGLRYTMENYSVRSVNGTVGKKARCPTYRGILLINSDHNDQ